MPTFVEQQKEISKGTVTLSAEPKRTENEIPVDRLRLPEFRMLFYDIYFVNIVLVNATSQFLLLLENFFYVFGVESSSLGKM